MDRPGLPGAKDKDDETATARVLAVFFLT